MPEEFQMSLIILSHSSFSSQKASNLKSFCLFTGSASRDSTIGLWSEPMAGIAKASASGNSNLHSMLHAALSNLFLTKSSPSQLFVQVNAQPLLFISINPQVFRKFLKAFSLSSSESFLPTFSQWHRFSLKSPKHTQGWVFWAWICWICFHACNLSWHVAGAWTKVALKLRLSCMSPRKTSRNSFVA